VAEASIVDLV